MSQPQPPFDPRPVTLEGIHVHLEPLHERHAEDLFIAGRAPEIWKYLPRAPIASVTDTRQMIAQANEAVLAGTEVAFAIVHKASGQAAGSSRYLDLRRKDRGLEIGWTWVGLAYQRTAVNTEAKLLLMTHAFETLGAIRVQLKTDERNLQSQAAIERIGAKREGVLRQHVILWDGFVRNTVMFSVVRAEWPAVKNHLRQKLERDGRQ